MVVVDKLSKEAHLIHVKKTHTTANITDIFLKEIFHLHGIQKIIISDQDPKFTGNYWKTLFKVLDTTINFNIAYHPQMDGQTNRFN